MATLAVPVNLQIPFTLGIPEILENIFEYCHDQDNRRNNVLVCKTWLEPCLNVIWRESYDLTNLVRLLGPTMTHGLVMEFVQTNVPLNWDRFSFYARRVRTIYQEGQDLQSYPKHALEYIFAHIAYQRPSNILELCPNLKVLEWCGDTHHHMTNPSILFMNSSLECYTLNENKPPPIKLAFVLRAVTDRCPNLKHVKLCLQQQPDPSYMDIIQGFIQSVKVLHSVDLPPFADMTPIISTLRDYQPHLRELRIQGCHTVDDRVDKACITSLALPSPCSNSLASLTLIDIVAPYTLVTELIENGLPLLQQAFVTSDFRKVETPSAVKRLMESLAKGCPRINYVCLSYDYYRYTPLPPSSYTVSVDHIRPLLKCTKMQNFTFKYPFPLTLDDQSAEEIASSWPEILQLQLCHSPSAEPGRNIKNCFTLRALLSFARHCPRITHLSLFLFTKSNTFPTLADIQTLPKAFFSKLQILDVGSSHMLKRDRHQIAQTLYRILPATAILQFDIDGSVEGGDDEDEHENEYIPLTTVGWRSLVHMISYARWMDETTSPEQRNLQSRIQEVEAENARLRTQIRSLHAEGFIA
ncbi:hypothetical protein F5880DRAFT_1201101 [Lentinula raphanica]|nr:hypothetical protein F5880DRAFT_1201101 [Lentinula raphanica]